MVENTNRPMIRFKGFTDAWGQLKLGEIAEKVTEKNRNGKFTETLTNSAEHGIISQRDFFDKDISNEKNLDTYYVVRPDDFVYNPRISNSAPVGPVKRNLLGRTGVMSPLYYVFRLREHNVTFVEKYFDTTYWHFFMRMNGDSGARSDGFNIKDSLLEELPLPFPKINEQTAIGNFFCILDNTLALHKRKLDKLKGLKKGYLQRMFPQNGESVPRLRFAGFVDEWKLCELGEAFKQTAEFVNPKEDSIELWSLTVENGLTPKTERYNRDFLVKKDDAFKAVAPNEFIYNPMNMTLGAVDLNMLDKKVAVSGYYITMQIKDGFDRNYFSVWLKSPKAINLYKLYATGGLTEKQRVQFPTLSNIKTLVPSHSEQAAIGNFFRKLDEQITLQSQKLEHLKKLKSAYLQKMFI